MTNEILFFTQVASIFAFVISVFVLYRLLVQNKDATISFLEKQLQQLQKTYLNQGSDPLANNLSQRIENLDNELNRLNKDKHINRALIEEKENELLESKEMFERLQHSVMFASSLSIEYFCPICKEKTIDKTETMYQFGNDKKEELIVSYRCGYSERNGKKVSECTYK